MEAHKVLRSAGYKVRSYGTGSSVRLPGPTIDKPNVFPFTTPYTKILSTLKSQDTKMHKLTGVLEMTQRNVDVKKAPERWPFFNQPPQRLPDSEWSALGFEDELDFDIVVTCEERCFDSVVDDFLARAYFEGGDTLTGRTVHCFNVEIRDEHQTALIGGKAILKLADLLSECHRASLEWMNSKDENSDLLDVVPFEDRIPDAITKWQAEHPNLPLLYCVCYH
ncbi:hypothetical protein CANARDRAFT_194726 [[Candida] arabinofermentans NRRL YB-2248]|uniref:RNA polymerase II subunit A C-terminal domain phosphatase SSU72 n=1 Tax=[Candida] arabinofermentans NRRL YB-2248 TaxID=983967 RepID=A0A1E4T774_9ASCO|nr:hypothetical protein CANARDRAFT_194726 [[Candida] arabinofermentans NRRL YB-2248]